MRKILLFLTLLCLLPMQVWAAAITSAQSGNWSATTTWTGGVKPGAGDTAVIATGHTVVVDENTTVGSNAAVVGHAVTIQATNSTTYGVLTVATGVTLTLRGFDLTNNTCIRVNQYAKFTPAAGSSILLDLAADNGSTVSNNGHIIADGVTISIPAAKVKWDNAVTSQSANGSTIVYDTATPTICIMKIKFGTNLDPGPISNAANNGIGSFGDTSFVVNSSNVLTNHVASYAAIANYGDYYVDHAKGIIYYRVNKSVFTTHTTTYSYKYANWFSASISSSANTVGSSVSIKNCTIRYMGSQTSQSTMASGTGIYAKYKYSPGLDSDRRVEITGNTFEYCTRPVTLDTCTGNSANVVPVTGNTFRHCRFSTSNYGSLIHVQTSPFVSFSNNTLDSYSRLFADTGGTQSDTIYVRYNTGFIEFDNFIPLRTHPAYFEYNTLSGYTASYDSGGFMNEGIVTGAAYYRYNNMSYGNRVVRIGNYMVVTDNVFSKIWHHGAVHRSINGYLTGYQFARNIISDSDAADMGGGWTLGYNGAHWIDNVEIANNTFDSSVRTINFNDGETTVVLGTRLKIYNNNCTNSKQGIYRPADNATNVTSMALARLDFNNDYGNTTTPTNVKQATFVKSGAEYNTNSRSCAGVYLFDPSYPLPMSVGKSLELVVSGTPGTDAAYNLSWEGGSAQNLVIHQGTATGGVASVINGSTGAITTYGTLVKSGAGWTANQLMSQTVKIVSGTGAGQYAMVKANTTDTLTIIPMVTTGVWVAPDATSVFIIFDSEVSLADGANSIKAGVFVPELPTTAATYTDADISITSNALAVDPQYNTSFAPQNAALDTSGFGGTYIGALDYVAPATPSVVTRRPFSMGFTFTY